MTDIEWHLRRHNINSNNNLFYWFLSLVFWSRCCWHEYVCTRCHLTVAARLPLLPLARPLFSPVSLGLNALFSSQLLTSPQCKLCFRRPQFFVFFVFFGKKAPQTLCQVLIKMIHVFIHFTRWLFIQFCFSEHLKNVFHHALWFVCLLHPTMIVEVSVTKMDRLFVYPWVSTICFILTYWYNGCLPMGINYLFILTVWVSNLSRFIPLLPLPRGFGTF